MSLLLSRGFGGTAAPNVPAPPADILAPMMVTGLDVVPGVDKVFIEFDPPADIHDGVTAANGCDNVDVGIVINGGAENVVQVDVPANALVRPTDSQIGSFTAPTVTWSGNDVTVISLGETGIDGPDAIEFGYWEVTGNFRLTTKFHSLSGSASLPDYALFGLMARETGGTATTQRYVSLQKYLRSNNQGLHAFHRAAVGNGYTVLASVNGVGGAAWGQIERSGNVFTWRYSFDGLTWLQLYSETLALNSTLRIGRFVAGYHASLAVTAIFRDLSYSTTARLSYEQAATYPSTVVARARVRDLTTTANLTAYTGTVSGDSQDETPDDELIKWNPGNYAQPNAYLLPTNQAEYESYYASVFDNGAYEGYFEGGVVLTTMLSVWPAAGIGNISFTDVDYALSRCRARGKRLIIRLVAVQVGSTEMFPAWMRSGGYVVDVGGYDVLDVSSSAGMELYMQLHEAFGAYYNSEPDIELIGTIETALSGINNNLWEANLARMKAAWPNTNVCLYGNYLDTVAQCLSIFGEMRTRKIGPGGPDTLPPVANGGDGAQSMIMRAYRGAGTTSEYIPGNYGTTDYRGTLPCASGSEFLGDAITAAEAAAWHNTQGTTHALWSLGNSGGGHDIADIVAAIAANPGNLRTGCPTSYGGLCSTG